MMANLQSFAPEHRKVEVCMCPLQMLIEKYEILLALKEDQTISSTLAVMFGVEPWSKSRK
jgi:hypothetical protein